MDDVCTDFHVAMRVGTKASIRLHEIVVHHAQNTEILVPWVGVFCKTEVKAGL